MPKQIFQRPAPVNRDRNAKMKGKPGSTNSGKPGAAQKPAPKLNPLFKVSKSEQSE